MKDYTLQQEIGRGTHSIVYKAVRTTADGDQTVAIKSYPAGFLSEPNQQQLFNNRAAIVSHLNHPAIIPVLDYGIIANGRPYLTMPLLSNGSLQNLLEATNGPLTLPEIGAILLRVSAALDAIHEQELLHRNITLQSILFDDSANPRLGGIEIAPLPNVGALNLLRDSNMTPNYLAPEQLQRQPSTPQTDIYALTAVLYQLLAETPPYTGDTPLSIAYKHLNDPIPELPNHSRYAAYKNELDQLIQYGMAKNPEDRPSSASELSTRFLDITGQPSASAQNSEPESTESPTEVAVEAEEAEETEPLDVPPLPPMPLLEATEQEDEGEQFATPSYSSRSENIFDPEAEVAQKHSPFVILAIMAVALTCILTILGASLGALALQRISPEPTSAFPTISSNDTGDGATAVPQTESSSPAQPITGLPSSGSSPDQTLASSPPEPLPAPLNPIRSSESNPALNFLNGTSSFSAADAGWHIFSNGNTPHDIVYHNGRLFAATGSGLVVADLESGDLTRYTAFDGLPSNSLTAVAICDIPSPQLYIGSNNGLALIEDPSATELSISNIWQANTHPIASNIITTLACTIEESGDGEIARLYIGHDDEGVNIFTPADRTWLQINTDTHGIRVDRSVDIAVSTDAIWIAHSYALSRYDRATGEVTIFEDDNSNIPSDSVRAVAIAPNGEVWLATIDGLVRGDGQGEWTLYDKQESANVPGGVGESVHVDVEGQVWFGTSGGRVCHFDPDRETCAEVYSFQGESGSDNMISALDSSPDGRIFIGHQQLGLRTAPIASPITEFSWQAFELDGQLPYHSVTALAESGSSMWIGTTRGLFEAPINDTSGAGWRAYLGYGAPLPNTWIRDLVTDGRGGIWVATTQGLAHITADYEISTFLTEVDVEVVLRDGENRIWIGTENGVYLWDGTSLLDLREWNGLPATDVASIGQNGYAVWIAFEYDVVARISGEEVTLFNDDDLDDVYFYAQEDMVSFNDELYMISGSSLLRAENGTFVEALNLDSIIESLYYHEASDTLLLGTWADGLYVWRNGELSQLSAASGLPSSYVTAIEVDSFGTLWVGGNNFSPDLHGGIGRYISAEK